MRARAGAGSGEGLLVHRQIAVSSCALGGGRLAGDLRSLSIIPVMGPSPLRPSRLPKLPPPNTISLGIGSQLVSFGGTQTFGLEPVSYDRCLSEARGHLFPEFCGCLRLRFLGRRPVRSDSGFSLWRMPWCIWPPPTLMQAPSVSVHSGGNGAWGTQVTCPRPPACQQGRRLQSRHVPSQPCPHSGNLAWVTRSTGFLLILCAWDPVLCFCVPEILLPF